MHNYRVYLMIVGCILVCSLSLSLAESNQTGNSDDIHGLTKSRQKRWLPRFPFNSCYALAVVLALPLELKGRNVFFSYNFETNYYFPYFDNVQGIVPLPFATIDQLGTNSGTLITNNTPLDEVRSLNDGIPTGDIKSTITETTRSLKVDPSQDIITNSTESSASQDLISAEDNNPTYQSNYTTNDLPIGGRRKSRAILEHLMTRARLYKMFESNMNSFGMNGRKCLQKAICDTSASSINEHNGIVGDIVHIIFTPSTSQDEHLPRDLIEAENRGKSHQCAAYAKLCPTSILDVISTYS